MAIISKLIKMKDIKQFSNKKSRLAQFAPTFWYQMEALG